MNKECVEDNEMLYRCVRKSYPDTFINGRPTPALFMKEKGISVDRIGNRTEEKVIIRFKERFNHYSEDYLNCVKILAKECRNAKTEVEANSGSNKYHALIYNDDKETEIPLLKAKMLADYCKVVEQV